MLVVFCVVFTLVRSYSATLTPFSIRNENSNLCIINILQTYYSNGNQTVYVDINSEDLETLKAIHLSQVIGIISRKTNQMSITYIDGYLIHVRNTATFINNFANLTRETTWNPSGKFLIVMESLEEIELRSIFNVLLKCRVRDVVILSGVQMYTYNPFENYSCGKYYSRIISLGSCLNFTEDLFPDKLVNGVKNCTINIGTTHWPPYAVIEQYILRVIAGKEQFHANFSSRYDAENFTTISLDLTASGPMDMLQKNETDIMIGGLLLIPSRASVFDYLHGHLDLYDTVNIVVKKASLVPLWKQFYTEFQPIVWALIFIVLFIYALLLVFLLRVKDKCYIFLKVLDVLFLHGFKIQGHMILKVIFVIWVVCAYMINCFYQTSLSSLTTKPSTDYQISKEEEISPYNLKPCVSNVMSMYSDSDSYFPLPDENNEEESCKTLLNSIKIVGNSSELYTLVLHSIYHYNKYIFLDEWGESSVYVFPKAMSSVIYAMYTYKGFPLQHKLQMYNLRLRENGCIDKILNDHYYFQMIQNHYRQKEFSARVVVPWLIYLVGIISSSFAFVLEIFHHHYNVQGRVY
ncbi:hypothetical protein K1T71_008702 [Dendrolimus kikuchii]|uniref:Uncharacterized protein n=1 Tax=Dendrolimus kikuchii TaxID=765133 RepID=A0ACC1CW63_9NEOP|nr:hypothetical protein K1T71_008702 [Dendrolimus kikuchii]